MPIQNLVFRFRLQVLLPVILLLCGEALGKTSVRFVLVVYLRVFVPATVPLRA